MGQIVILVTREVAKEFKEMILPAVTPIIIKFVDMFSKHFPDQLPTNAEYPTCY